MFGDPVGRPHRGQTARIHAAVRLIWRDDDLCVAQCLRDRLSPGDHLE